MDRLAKIRRNVTSRKRRVRANIIGTTDRPRLTVMISNQHVHAQIIDDSQGHTLVSAASPGQKQAGKTLTEKAVWVGEEIAKKAATAKIKKVVLDRKGRLYHGRIKALADAARKQGLEF